MDDKQITEIVEKVIEGLAMEFTKVSVTTRKAIQQVRFEPLEFVVTETRICRIEERDEMVAALYDLTMDDVSGMFAANGMNFGQKAE